MTKLNDRRNDEGPMEDRMTKVAVLLVTSLSSFLTPVMAASVTVALPAIGRELGMDAVLLSWVVTAYLLGVGVSLIPMGRLADIYGRKRLFACGVAAFTVFSVLCTRAPSGYVLILYRFLQGAGAAMIFGNGVAMLTSVFSASQRGRVLGFNIATVYLGLSIGPFYGGVLTDHFGWRSVFYSMIPLGVLIIAVTLAGLKKEWAEAKGEPFDYPGSILYGITLVALIYGITMLTTFTGAVLTLAGLSGIVVFLKREKKVKHPMLNVDLLSKNKVFAFSNLAALISYAATHAVAFLLSFYFQSVRGMTAQDTGLILITQPIVQTVFTPLAGRLSDRVEPRVLASVGMGLTVAGLALFSLLSERTLLWHVAAILGLLGLGFAFFAAPNANAVMGSVERKYYGVASGTLATTRVLGQIFSMGITGLVFAVHLGRVAFHTMKPIQFLGSMKPIFLIFAGLCIVGVFASMVRGTMHDVAQPGEHEPHPPIGIDQ